ncbi:DUF4307 domain-containing protein [Nocardioides sp. S-58]|uniref:DUF4307 domain-containing protein n=1 Tax=Nocardioides renjunii TaxID=3095075 RepID=A0ABU5K7N4_9ACTN|nr:DUF4307 domain-containing protein [Nocardioides sp. S-58]MDZ5660489.1 DUF4307 domain-containing protein [Nocardioides sp. S-58]
MTTDLAERYGAPAPWRRPVTIGVAVLVAVVGLTWLAWTAWFHSTPAVTSEVITYDVAGDHEVRSRVNVELADDVEATCRVRAYSEDHTTVGELAFTPVDGTNEVVIRTERRATTVEKLGCTAPGQPRPR